MNFILQSCVVHEIKHPSNYSTYNKTTEYKYAVKQMLSVSVGASFYISFRNSIHAVFLGVFPPQNNPFFFNNNNCQQPSSNKQPYNNKLVCAHIEERERITSENRCQLQASKDLL